MNRESQARGFHRGRMSVADKVTDYISEHNRIFNEKIERDFGKYASEIKSNLERGSAL